MTANKTDKEGLGLLTMTANKTDKEGLGLLTMTAITEQIRRVWDCSQ